jgi:hypothetical protein
MTAAKIAASSQSCPGKIPIRIARLKTKMPILAKKYTTIGFFIPSILSRLEE